MTNKENRANNLQSKRVEARRKMREQIVESKKVYNRAKKKLEDQVEIYEGVAHKFGTL